MERQITGDQLKISRKQARVKAYKGSKEVKVKVKDVPDLSRPSVVTGEILRIVFGRMAPVDSKDLTLPVDASEEIMALLTAMRNHAYAAGASSAFTL